MHFLHVEKQSPEILKCNTYTHTHTLALSPILQQTYIEVRNNTHKFYLNLQKKKSFFCNDRLHIVYFYMEPHSLLFSLNSTIHRIKQFVQWPLKHRYKIPKVNLIPLLPSRIHIKKMGSPPQFSYLCMYLVQPRETGTAKIYVKSPVFFFSCELMHQNAFSLSFLTRDGIPIQTTQKNSEQYFFLLRTTSIIICIQQQVICQSEYIYNALRS